MNAATTKEAALTYTSRGWPVVYMDSGSKGPTGKRWQDQRLNVEEVTELMADGQNVGLLLGKPSGLVDVDCDTAAAVICATHFLPATDMVHGRPGKRCSHYWYRVSEPNKSLKYQFPAVGCLIEVRSTGGQTVVPPSTHPSGERYHWDRQGEPATATWAAIVRAASKTAAAALLAHHWTPGVRNSLKLSVSGGLLRAGWEEDAVVEFLVAVADAADSSTASIAPIVRATADKLDARENVVGWPATAGIIGDAAVTKIREWLGVSGQSASTGADLARLDAWPDSPKVAGAGERPKKPKYEDQASAYYARECAAGREPLHTGGRNYSYTGCRYSPCDELLLRLRKFFLGQGWPQSNNPLGNVKGIVEAMSWRDGAECGTMPFWCGGEEAPFGDAKNVIPYSNGLLDLTRPGDDLIGHSPAWCSTFCLPYAYDPAATCPVWVKFLGEIFEGDGDRIALLQEYAGYCLASDTSLQKALCLIGKPRSGKGTVQRVFASLVGKADATGFSLDKLATEFGLSSLLNKSLALVGEVELTNSPHRNKIVEVLKSIIGEDEVSINIKHDPTYRSVRLGTRFLIAANAVPTLHDDSGALAHRLMFLPFEVSFFGREDVGLEAKLAAELAGISNWALAGLRRLRAGGGKFTLGAGHQKAHGELAMSGSPVLAWVKAEMLVSAEADPGDLPRECVASGAVTISKEEAYNLYVSWCVANDVNAKQQIYFGKALREVLPKLKNSTARRHGGGTINTYGGFGKRPAL